MPAGGAVAARARSAPTGLAAGDQPAASVPLAYGGESRDQAAGTHLSTIGARDRTVGIVDRAQYFKALLAIIAAIFIQWHLQTS